MSTTTATQHPNQISVRVAEAIADTRGTDVLDLQPPLYDTIDPNALDELVAGDYDISVQFDYQGHAVTVRSDGTVLVDDRVYE